MSSALGKCIDEALSAVLLPRGFRRERLLFLRQSEDVVHLVQLQGSDTNTHNNSRYTVNLGVWVPALAFGETRSLAAAHWRQRLGLLCPEHEDMWWQPSTRQSISAVAADISDRMQRYALPSFASLVNADALLVVWRGGTSPGLTKVQANRFAHLLEAAVP